MALYGGWPATAGQQRPLTNAQILVASKLPVGPHGHDRYPLRPWLQHHGIAEDPARRVICTLELLRPDQWLNASLELLVRMAYRPGHSHFEALRDSDKGTADKLFAALRGVRDATRRGVTPTGAILNAAWWSGKASYVGGRAPMERMRGLPDEILRHVCDFLASDPGADRELESSLAASGQFRADWDSSPFSAHPDITVAISFEELNDMGDRFEPIYDSILFGIESSTERLAAALRLRAVASAWSRALRKRTLLLKGRVDRLTSEKGTLKGIKRTASAIYESFYDDLDDFANPYY